MTGGRVLVVGGAGYIGSHACKALAESGFEPVTFDNFSTGHRDFVRWGPLVEGDILDQAALAAAIEGTQPVAALHFAGITDVGHSVRDPLLYYRVNVTGSVNLAAALLRFGCTRLVFSSTCAVYGQSETLPIGESTPTKPVSPYGRSKLMVEEMLQDASRAYGLRSVVFRFFNACGADPGSAVGERHDPETHLIPRAILAAMGRTPPIHVFGSDHPTADGTCVRDYVHVDDLAAAHVLALRYLLDGGGSETVNIASGRGYSVAEVLAAIAACSGRPVPVIAAPRRPGDPAEVRADGGRSRQVLGFRPVHSDMGHIVRTAWRWHAADGR